MKSRISETEKIKEYLDYSEDEKKYYDESKDRLDLNVLLKRLKDKNDSDKKINLIIITSLVLTFLVAAIILIK